MDMIETVENWCTKIETLQKDLRKTQIELVHDVTILSDIYFTALTKIIELKKIANHETNCEIETIVGDLIAKTKNLKFVKLNEII